ncbi:MAG: NAD(P)H-hydrate dehydratase [Campylobacterota bacterium]
MQRVFDEVGSLDKRCYEEFALSEDILMEQAASNISNYIESNYCNNEKVVIVCGLGNNGADGLALARLLYKKFNVKIYLVDEPKSKMAKLQYRRVKALNIKFTKKIKQADIIVDCIFGSGLNRPLKDDIIQLIDIINSIQAFKIACDIPTGINYKGQVQTTAFKADLTLTMGALKSCLFLDEAKEYVGDIIVGNLGVQREVYETKSNMYLLDKEDLKLPFREEKNSHKGSFGHLNVVAGCKKGAGIIAAKAAFGIGAGLVTVISHEELDLPYHIMQAHFIVNNCTAIAIGMGLGKFEEKEIKKILSQEIPILIDADLFYEKLILDVLHKDVVLTPHPKEFCSLLKICDIANITIEELQSNRLYYVNKFIKKYDKPVLLLKGANVIIAQNERLFINDKGNSVLSKAGSGDVLSGLIASLLAQGYNSLNAAISGSLAHSLAARNYSKNDYSLIPSDLVEEVRRL